LALSDAAGGGIGAHAKALAGVSPRLPRVIDATGVTAPLCPCLSDGEYADLVESAQVHRQARADSGFA